MKNRNKKPLIALLVLLLVGVVGGTLAYFTSSATFENIFKTKPYSTVFTEEFVSPENWTPGTVTDKTVVATNTGNVDVAVRVSYDEVWKDSQDNDLALTFGDPAQSAAIIHFANTDDWTLIDGYYYYNEFIANGETTSTFIESVEFNENAVNSLVLNEQTGECVTEETASGKTVTCTSKGDGYDNATYTLTIDVETVQADAVKEFWNVNIENGTVTAVTTPADPEGA